MIIRLLTLLIAGLDYLRYKLQSRQWERDARSWPGHPMYKIINREIR